MKIGILTYHHTSNFGSLLQTYGLYKCISDFGYDCEVVDYRNERVEQREKTLRFRDCTSIRNIAYYFIFEPKLRKKVKQLNEFSRKMMHISNEVYFKSSINNCKNTYDCFVVGSDLVWDFTNNGNDTTYMLDFVDDNTTKIAYASSCGSVWNNNDIKLVKDLLSRFDAIGVREKEIQQKLLQIGVNSVDFVCDPTMLIDSSIWKDMAEQPQISGDYVLCYFEDKNKTIYKDALAYGKKYSIPVYAISYKRLPKGIKAVRPTTIGQFLALILNAKCVFSASYHGMLFSLYFEKELYFYKKGWNARQESLAAYLNISNRAGYKTDNKMDYNYINQQIAKFRDYSKNRLRDYLSIAENKV